MHLGSSPYTYWRPCLLPRIRKLSVKGSKQNTWNSSASVFYSRTITYAIQICTGSRINSHFWLIYYLARYHLLLGIGKKNPSPEAPSLETPPLPFSGHSSPLGKESTGQVDVFTQSHAALFGHTLGIQTSEFLPKALLPRFVWASYPHLSCQGWTMSLLWHHRPKQWPKEVVMWPEFELMGKGSRVCVRPVMMWARSAVGKKDIGPGQDCSAQTSPLWCEALRSQKTLNPNLFSRSL